MRQWRTVEFRMLGRLEVVADGVDLTPVSTEAGHGAGVAASARRRDRQRRRARRGTLGRAAAGDCADGATRARFGSAKAARSRADRDAPAGVSPSARIGGRVRHSSLRADDRRGVRGRAHWCAPRSSARRSPCSAASRWLTSPTTRSRRASRIGSKNCGSHALEERIETNLQLGWHVEALPELERLTSSIRTASGCAVS